MTTATILFLTLVNQYQLPPTTAATLTCIAYEESKFNTKALNTRNRNGTKDYGLFQINSVWLSKCDDLYSLHKNIACAIMVYNKQGITAWSTHKRCI